VYVQNITRLKTYTCFFKFFTHAQTIKLQNYIVVANYKAQNLQN